LLAGTQGRGAWTVPDASESILTHSELFLEGTANADVFELERDAASPWLLDVFVYAAGQARPATPLATVFLTALETITIDGLDGDDQFIIGAAHGALAVPGGITIDGGGQSLGDSLRFTAGSAIVTGKTVKPGADAKAGTEELRVVDPFRRSGTQVVTWTDVETKDDAGIVVSKNIDTVRAGFNDTALALGGLLDASLRNQHFAGIDLASLGGALNGRLVEAEGAEEDAAAGLPELGGRVQLTDVTAWLLRLLETNGVRLSTMANPGAFAQALKTAFGDTNVTFDDTGDVDGDSQADLLYDVH